MGLLSFGDFKFLWPCVVCLFHFFDFCWVLLFPKLFSWNRFFSRIYVIDSWWWFCVFEEISDVLHPKPVSCFGTFFTIFFQSYSISDFLERPDLVCNHTSCSILGVFYFLENSAFFTRMFFPVCVLDPLFFLELWDLFRFRIGYFSFEVFVLPGGAWRCSLELLF
jgi:hypothetical protein